MKKFGDKFMATVKIGPKGQIVIPKEVREMFELNPGDSMVLLADSVRGIALQRTNFLTNIADAIFAGKGQERVPEATPEENVKFAELLTEELKENGE